MLANDGAHVFSVDIDSIQVRPALVIYERTLTPPQEYTKRPRDTGAKNSRYHPRHVVHASNKTLEECLALSDVVITAVPDPKYKVRTEWLKDGCVCVNVSAEKNFEANVREKVSGVVD